MVVGTDWTNIASVKRHLQTQEKSLAPFSIEVADTLTRLADLFFIDANYLEAEALYWRALEIRQRVLGEAHEDTATSLKNLAELYEIQDRYAEAERFYQWSASARKKSLLVKHEKSMEMTQSTNLFPPAEKMRQATCKLCKRPLLDSKVCLYCTQGTGFDAASIIAAELVGLNLNTPKLSASPAVNTLTNTDTGRKYILDDTEITLGRHPSNTIVLSGDKFTSRYHALIKFESGCFWIDDRNTDNGTFLNSHRLSEKTRLCQGDTISIGKTVLHCSFEN